MKSLIVLMMIVGFSAASCVPRAIPFGIPAAPKQTVSVVPAVAKVTAEHAKSNGSSILLKGQVKAIAEDSRELNAGIAGATMESDRLRKMKSLLPSDLERLWSQLSALNVQSAMLAKESVRAVATAESHQLDRERESQALSKLAVIAAERDTETEALRSQRSDLASSVTSQAKAIASLQDAAAVGNWMRRWFAIVAVCACLAFIGWSYLRASPISWLKK